MTPSERELLEYLDQIVLNASDEDLKIIQSIDFQTQMSGLSFCDVFVNSTLVNHIQQKNHDSRK
jgi:hypothetical protein